jgi:hypothetical protein
MRKAILRFDAEGEPSMGFHRPGALLAVVIVTDETDCSYHGDHETIFLPEGNRVFWSDTEAASPTSAVCWYAGIECVGNGAPYDECYAQSFDEDGNNVDGPNEDDDAVLHPVVRYVAELAINDAYAFSIDGVGLDGSIVYQDSLDAQLQNDFGIGPACESQAGFGVPSVRVREVVESTSGPGSQGSICSDSYAGHMTTFVQGILDRLP